MDYVEKQKLVKTNHTEIEMGGGPKGPKLQTEKHANYLVAVSVETNNQPQIEEKVQAKTPDDIGKNSEAIANPL